MALVVWVTRCCWMKMRGFYIANLVKLGLRVGFRGSGGAYNWHQQQITQATHCLVGHIHFDKKQLSKMNVSMEDILQECQEEIYRCRKKKGQMNQVMKRIALISSECTCYQDADEEPFEVSCLQFFLTESVTTQIS